MPTQLKDQVPYPFVHPDDLLDELSESMLLSAYTHGCDPDIDRKVAEGYERLFGTPFDPAIATFSPELDDDPMPGVTLHGPPGHGKSTVMREAAKRAAGAMGMDFRDMDQLGHGEVTRNHFLFAVREMAARSPPSPSPAFPPRPKGSGTGRACATWRPSRSGSSP